MHSPATLLITGANGFVGRELCRRAAETGHRVRAAVRTHASARGLGGDALAVGTLTRETDWTSAVVGVDVVVHLAARVHVMRETENDPLAAIRATNVEATEALARASAAAGVKRLVYVSSIKVNGERTGAAPFRADDPPHPQDAYGTSKWEAEQSLARVAEATGLQITVVRPPLVYGPGVAGNFLRLLRLIDRGIPLPFGAIENHRSLIYVGNLADALVTCATHELAGGKTYLVSDGEDLSTAALVRELAEALGRRARLLPVPAVLLRIAGRIAAKSAEVDRLIGSLRVDSSPIRADLGWRPPAPVGDALRSTAAWFRSGQRGAGGALL